jgi:hypothetical protein
MKNYPKMATIVFAGTAVISLLLLSNTALPAVSAQTGGNVTEMLQSAKQGSTLSFPVQQGSQVFVVICTGPQECTAYDLTPAP